MRGVPIHLAARVFKIGTTTANAVDTNPSTFTTGLTLTNMVAGASRSQTLATWTSTGNTRTVGIFLGLFSTCT